MKHKYTLGYGLIIGAFLLVLYNSSSINKNESYIPETTPKYILYWTPMFNRKDFNLGFGSEIFSDCEYKNCFATANRSLVPLEEFSAILFHGIEYTEQSYGKPETRTPSQFYVYSNQESPTNTGSHLMNTPKGFYNWTMTYRVDSDIPRRYGYLKKTKTNYVQPTVEEIQKKQFRIAWFVSNCATQSQRMKLAMEINKYIPVDIYGRCGRLFCPRNKEKECYDMVEKKYKFYFSAENSLCADYITEKLFNMMEKNVIPLAYAGAEFNKFVPRKSVIDVSDFDTVAELVKYLKFLDENPERYIEYFEWKKDFVVDKSNRMALCTLCEKLHTYQNSPKIYEDIASWWFGEKSSMCKSGNRLPNIVRNIKTVKINYDI